MRSFVLKAWPLARFCGNRVPWVTEQVTALELGRPGPNVASACSTADWKASGLHHSSCTGLFGFVQPLCVAFLLLCADLLRGARKRRREGARGGLRGAGASTGRAGEQGALSAAQRTRRTFDLGRKGQATGRTAGASRGCAARK